MYKPTTHSSTYTQQYRLGMYRIVGTGRMNELVNLLLQTLAL